MNISVLNAHGVLLIASDFFSELFSKPIHTSFYHTLDKENINGLSKVEFKFILSPSSQMINWAPKSSNSFWENWISTDIINLSFGVKYNKKYNNELKPFLDFNFYNINGHREIDQFSTEASIQIIEKKTNYELDRNYNWIRLAYNLGYNLIDKKENTKLIPMLHLALGLNSFNIDTLVFNNLELNNLANQYTIAEYGLQLQCRYKYLTVVLDYTKFINFGEIKRTFSGFKISYTIYENMDKSRIVEGYSKDIKFVSFFCSYNNNVYEFSKKDLNTSFLLSSTLENFNFGLTLNLNWIFEKRKQELGCGTY